MKTFFLLILFFSTSLFSQEHKEFVNSLDDFYMHMRNHVNNVELMADKILIEIEKNPTKWRAVFNLPAKIPIDDQFRNELKIFIENHDASKLNTSKEFLKKIGHEKGLINDLYKVYGKTFKDMSPNDKKIVDELNIVDAGERKLFIKEHNIPSWKIKLFDEIEKMADGVERGMNPLTAEEMAKTPWRESEGAEKKLLNAVADKKSTGEIKELRSKYKLIVEIENQYSKEATHFNQFRSEMLALKKALHESGIFVEYLDDFSFYRLMDEYKKYVGNKINSDDPSLASKLKSYFFQNSNGEEILKSSISPTAKTEAKVMIEMVKYEMNPAKNSRWKNLYQAFGGMCGN